MCSGREGWPWGAHTPLVPGIRSDGSPWPRISIVTPSYNQGQFIEETIISVLKQGYPNLEYIVIDGGSTDDTVEIIKKYEGHLAYWVSEKDRGQSHAINKGMARATGDILAWLNSDDLYLPGALARVAEHFRGSVNLVTGGMVSFTGLERTNFVLARAAEYGLRPSVAMLFASSPHLHQSSTFWTSDLWSASGSRIREDLHNAMDAELWLRFMHTPSARLAVVDFPLSVFRRHASQKTANWDGYGAELRDVRAHYLRGKGKMFPLKVAAWRRMRPILHHRNIHPRLGLKPPGDVSDLKRLLQTAS